ncbi:MAG: membrane-bound PQQ-dependent dehydrogenase, glucose/quinate/shikimate family, partial [Casimicrobiaceae bacterium]
MATHHRSRLAGFAGAVGVLLSLAGVVVAAAGGYLASLGGTWYYVVAGAGLLLTGVLLIARSPAALWVHALLVAGTLAWAIWESGLDWWPLAARLDALFLIGLLLVAPWITRRLGYRTLGPIDDDREIRREDLAPRTSWRTGGGLALTLSLVAFAVVAVITWVRDPHSIDGTLPPSQGQLTAAGTPIRGVPPDEWQAYGRTSFGQRYSPLSAITPENVTGLEVVWQFRTGDMRGRPGDPNETTFEVTPLKVGDRLYLCTPHQAVIALDATTGREVWRYTPLIQDPLALQHLTCRGLSYQPAKAAATGTDAARPGSGFASATTASSSMPGQAADPATPQVGAAAPPAPSA